VKGGERINANQVPAGGLLRDLRGPQGNLATVVWADDSQGVPAGFQRAEAKALKLVAGIPPFHVARELIRRVAAAEGAAMLADDPSVLADHDTIGIGMNLDRSSDGARCHRVLVVVEAHQTGWCWPRKTKWHPEEYRRAREAARQFADPIGRSSGQGRPWIWRAVIAAVSGYEIRSVSTRFGRLFAVGDSGWAFSTQAQAEAYARKHPR
jgi:hypothetical protein